MIVSNLPFPTIGKRKNKYHYNTIDQEHTSLIQKYRNKIQMVKTNVDELHNYIDH